MGASWPKHGPSEVRMVRSLGVNDKGTLIDPTHKKGSKKRGLLMTPIGQNIVRCEEGHAMDARVTEELWHSLPSCRAEVECIECGGFIDGSQAYYRCASCSETLCIDCSRERLGLPRRQERGPPLEILPGDIFLCGPDKYGIHHVILSRGHLQKEDETAIHIGLEPGSELWSCSTVEATQGSHGESTWWYAAQTYFTRDSTGAAFLVADVPDDEWGTFYVAEEPVPCKVLLHPFRRELGNFELDYGLFHSIIEHAAGESKKYGKQTAVKSWIANQKGPGIIAKTGILQPASYPDSESRCMLLDKIYKSWNEPPICSSVAIKTWQMYFDAVSDQADEAAQCILDWVPCFCHRTVPSAMVKVLSSRGWILSSTFDAWQYVRVENDRALPTLMGRLAMNRGKHVV